MYCILKYIAIYFTEMADALCIRCALDSVQIYAFRIQTKLNNLIKCFMFCIHISWIFYFYLSVVYFAKMSVYIKQFNSLINCIYYTVEPRYNEVPSGGIGSLYQGFAKKNQKNKQTSIQI